MPTVYFGTSIEAIPGRYGAPGTRRRNSSPVPNEESRYRGPVPELVAPTTRLHAAWLEAHAEWGTGLHEDGFGLEPADEVESPAGFAAWLDRLATHRCVYRWVVDGDRVLGGIALRHGNDEYIRWAGHIGYGIRPSARR